MPDNNHELIARQGAFSVDAELQAVLLVKGRAFLTAFAEHKSISKACRIAELSRRQFNQLRELDDDFASRYENLNEETADDMEGVLVTVASDAEMPAGTRVAAATKYLEGNRPEKYGKRGDTGSGNVNVQIIIGEDPAKARTIDVKAKHAAQE